MPAVSKKQQKFFGMVRAAQKGEMKNPSKEILDVANDISMKDAKKFAKTKHKGLPEKKKMNEDNVLKKVAKQLDGASKMHKQQANKVKKHIRDMHREGMYDTDPKTGESPVATSVRKGNKKKGDDRLKHFAKLAKKMVGEENIDEKCWKGYEKKGMKTMFGKRYPNCVKKEEVENVREGDGDPCWDTHKQVGMKKKGGKMVPNCVPKNEEVKKDEYGDPVGGPKISKKQKVKNLSSNTPDEQHTTTTSEAKYEAGASTYGKATIRNKRKFGTPGEMPDIMTGKKITKDATRGELIAKRREEHKAKRGVKEEIVTESDKKGKGSGTKDACYHKVKSRYSVWPSAYASGALVKCRKVGAANWGNSKKEEFSDWRSEFIWEDGDPEKKLNEESNPRIPRKKGQPANSKKHSDLYTDENPKGTIHGLGFKDVATAKASVSKIRGSSRSHAHKIQAAVAMEQRAREMGKTSEAAVYRKYINSMKKKTKKMNEEKYGDHEPEMIRSQLKTAGRASKRIEKHSRKKDNFKAWVQSKITKASDYLDTAADYLDSKDMKKEAANPAQQAAIAINMKKKGKKPKDMSEGSLHKWFKGSKSKDGKGGWVNVVTGGTCASDEPGEGTPKCVSSAKRASMTKAERLSAARRKKKADPGQQQKTGAAKPTYVSTDKPKKKKVNEAAAWTKKSGKNPSGGLNEKGRKSYERENPGSDLKAPSKKVGNKRRASFCARMKGMKKKLTSAKTARDPDSRINKSLRAWNCERELDGNVINEEVGYKSFIKQAQDARDRVKQKGEEMKKKDASYIDRVRKGIKFYDKKGSGRIVKGQKVYD